MSAHETEKKLGCMAESILLFECKSKFYAQSLLNMAKNN